jgi:cold shock CspA family protein
VNETFYGTVIDYHSRGFFFLLPDNSRKQIFGHIRDVLERLTLKVGDRVSFQMEPSPKGTRAIHVRLLIEVGAR